MNGWPAANTYCTISGRPVVRLRSRLRKQMGGARWPHPQMRRRMELGRLALSARLSADLNARLRGRRGVAGHAAQAQAHALALLIEADDLGRNDLARLEQIARLRLWVDVQFAGVDQPFDRLFDLDERAK